MSNSRQIHIQEQKVIKQFNQGIKLYDEGYLCPTDESPIKRGWLAAQEMNKVKKYWLSKAKDDFIDV